MNLLKSLKDKIVSFYNYIKRSFYSRKFTKLKKTSSSKKVRYFDFPIFDRNLVAVLSTVFVVVLVIVHLLTLLNFQTVKFFGYDLSDTSGSEKTTLLVVYNKQNSSGIEYKFISSASVFINRNDEDLLLSINPGFILNTDEGESIAIKSFLNSPNNLDNLNNLANYIEDLYSIKVDSYVICEQSELISFIDAIGFKFDIKKANIEDVEIVNGFKKDNYNAILNYIFPSTDEILDEAIILQQEFFRQISKHFSLINKYKMFWQLDKVENTFFTDLNASQFISLVSKLKSNDINYFYTNRIIRQEVFPQIAMNVNIKLLDELLNKNLQDIDIVAEQPEIEIYNASSIPGQASKYSRVLKNRGASVVKVGNFFETRDKNYLYLESEEDLSNFSNTIELIKEYAGDNINIIIDDYEYNKTGNIILVLGG